MFHYVRKKKVSHIRDIPSTKSVSIISYILSEYSSLASRAAFLVVLWGLNLEKSLSLDLHSSLEITVSFSFSLFSLMFGSVSPIF